MKSSVTWLLIEKILRVLNGILVGAAVARYLEPDAFGYLAVALATISIFTAAAGMGAEHTNISQLTKRAGIDQLFFSSIFLTRLVWSSAVSAVAVVYFLIQGAGSIDSIYLILLILIQTAAFSLFANAIAAHAEFKEMSIISVIGLLLGNAIRVYGIIQGYGIAYFAGCMVTESLISVCLNGGYLYCRHALKPLSFSADFAVMKEYFYLCLPTSASATLVTIYLRIELFVVLYSLGKQSAGLWAAAMMFITPWGMVANSILPVANQLLAKKQLVVDSDYEKKMILLIRLMLLLSVIFAFINIITVGILAPLLLGDQYAPIVSIVAICSIGLIPLFMGSVQEIWIAHQNTTKVVLKKVLIGLPLSATFLWGGAMLYGLRGIAIAMVVSYVVTALLLNWLFDRNFLFLQFRALGIKNE